VSLEARFAELEDRVAQLISENTALRARVEVLELLEVENTALRAEIVSLKSKGSKHSGNSSMPPSRDPAGERQRQATERQAKKRRAAGGTTRRAGGQPGSPGTTRSQTDTPDVIIDHAPECCAGCGAGLEHAAVTGTVRRQSIDIPPVKPVVTEHRVETRTCACGVATAGRFPDHVRAPVSYGPGIRATVVYLLARQHIPVARCAEAMRDLFSVRMSTGTIDAIYSDAAHRLGGFITALVTCLRNLAVVHVDETTDRIGTVTCWMHVVSTNLFTLIHASATRGVKAVHDAGVLAGYTGVIVHDRLAMYWQFRRAKHQVCGAHLLRDLASVAQVATQQAWASGLASLLVEINTACDQARSAGHRSLAPTRQREFATRYDNLVADGRAANPDPPAGRKRNSLQRDSHNLAVAFETHRRSILRFMYNLDVGLTNNQAERDLRPVKIHRKISSCFRDQTGAERFAHVRSYLSTTRKHDIPAIDALTQLFNNNPWMPFTT
jgi:transposase